MEKSYFCIEKYKYMCYNDFTYKKQYYSIYALYKRTYVFRHIVSFKAEGNCL